MRTVTVSSKSRAGGRTQQAQAPRPSPTPGGGRAWGLRLRPGDGGARARAGASVPDPPVTDPSAACPLLGAWDQPSQPRFRCGLLCSDTQAGMAPAGPRRSQWPSPRTVVAGRRHHEKPSRSLLRSAPADAPGLRASQPGVLRVRRSPRESHAAAGPCQLRGCGCSPAKGETANDDNHHELAPRRRAHLRSRRPSPRHGAAETKHSRPPPPPPARANPQPAQAPHRTGHGGARPPAGAPPHTTHAEPQWRTGVHRENSTRNFQKEAEEKLGGAGSQAGRARATHGPTA